MLRKILWTLEDRPCRLVDIALQVMIDNTSEYAVTIHNPSRGDGTHRQAMALATIHRDGGDNDGALDIAYTWPDVIRNSLM